MSITLSALTIGAQLKARAMEVLTMGVCLRMSSAQVTKMTGTKFSTSGVSA